MEDSRYVLAVMRSRQHTLRYETMLNRAGIRAAVISTPREAAIGCGLSLKIPYGDLRRVLEMWRRERPEGLAGVYLMEPGGRGRLKSVRIMGMC